MQSTSQFLAIHLFRFQQRYFFRQFHIPESCTEVRLYDRLFTIENPDSDSFKEYLNPDSLEVLNAFVEPGLANAVPGYTLQFERQGYFCVDQDSSDNKLVINRTVPLRDSWAKIANKNK